MIAPEHRRTVDDVSSADPPAGCRWHGGLLDASDPDPVGVDRPEGRSNVLLLCDHAGNRLPRRLGSLGVSPDMLERHVAIDIGALGAARHLSQALDATLLWQRYSRLVIDCNRPPHVPAAFVVEADGAHVSGNAALAPSEAAARVAELFHPYHAAIDACLSRRAASGTLSVVVSVHSFTPRLSVAPEQGPHDRPWHIGVLFGRDDRLARPLIRLLQAEPGLSVGINEPYAVDDDGDYAIPVHVERRALLHVEIELRQDLIADAAGQRRWAQRLARLLPQAVASARAAAAAPGQHDVPGEPGR